MDSEFYVCLLSNSSTNVYENTLSSFTNLLSKPCRLNEYWSVGVTEIAFNEFTKSQKAKRSIPDEIEIIDTLIPMRKRKRETENDLLTIKDKQLIIYQNDFKKACYSNKDMNFGSLLNLLEKYILKNDEKLIMKNEILAAIDKSKDINYEKLKKGTYDFIVHIYQGSSKSSNVLLKPKTYNNVDELIQSLISQIPISDRKLGKLKGTVMSHFYADEHTTTASTAKSLTIPFDDLGVKISINLSNVKKQPNGSLNLQDVIDNLSTKVEHENQKDVEQLIKQRIDDFFRDFDFKQQQQHKMQLENSFKVNVPVENSKVVETLVDNKDYSSIKKFLGDIYKQIPVALRNKEILSKTISENMFNETKIIKRSTEFSTEYDLLYVYSDIIKPRHLGNIQSRYLKVIPTSSDRVIRFKHVEYCPIEPSYIESISIVITDGSGENVNFKASTTPTYIMLHFKRNDINTSGLHKK